MMRSLFFANQAGGVGLQPLFTDLNEQTVRGGVAAGEHVVLAEPELRADEVWEVVDRLRGQPLPINVVASWG